MLVATLFMLHRTVIIVRGPNGPCLPLAYISFVRIVAHNVVISVRVPRDFDILVGQYLGGRRY